MKDYSVLDNMIRMVGDTIKQAFDKGYKQGYKDGLATHFPTDDDAIDHLQCTGWMERHDKAIYEQGLNDAWLAAKKLVLDENAGGLESSTVRGLFHCNLFDVFSEGLVKDVVSALKEYEEKQKADEIQIGDEVIMYGTGSRKVVVEIKSNGCPEKRYVCFGKTGVSTEHDGRFKPVKTGRHFDQIEAVLRQMQEDEE